MQRLFLLDYQRHRKRRVRNEHSIKSVERISAKMSVAFADDNGMVIGGCDSENKMEMILNIHDDLHSATGGCIEEEKSKYYAWK